MTTTWYYNDGEAQKGPVSEDDLQLALSRGEVDRQSLVWRNGMPEWQPLETVDELQPLLEHIPPPLPEQPPPLPAQPPQPPPPVPAT